MTHEEVIRQLLELIDDRKSFIISDAEHDEIYEKDIAALNYSIHAIDLTIPKKVPHSDSDAYGVARAANGSLNASSQRTEISRYGTANGAGRRWIGKEVIKHESYRR